MKKFLLFLNFFLLGTFLAAQPGKPVRFDRQPMESSNSHSFLLGLPNSNLIYFWVQEDGIYCSKSTDDGINWQNPQFITYTHYFGDKSLNAIIADSNKILFIYKNNFHKLLHSYDNGDTWFQSNDFLPTGNTNFQKFRAVNSFLSKDNNGNIYLSYSRSITSTYESRGLYFIKSTDNGNTWSFEFTIPDQYGNNPALIQSDLNTLMVVYDDSINISREIYKRKSTDNGLTWSSAEPLVQSSLKKIRPRIIKGDNRKLWIFYQQFNETNAAGIFQPDIVFIESNDNGNTWGTPKNFTSYPGLDEWHNVSIWKNYPIVSFSSSRAYNSDYDYMQLYFGTKPDNYTPPVIYLSSTIPPDNIQPGEPVSIIAYLGGNYIQSVKIIVTKNVFDVQVLQMFDDGLHNDLLPGDNIYGITLPGFSSGDAVKYDFLVQDTLMNITSFKGGQINIPLDFLSDILILNHNRLKLPFNSSGGIGKAIIKDTSILIKQFDEGDIIFSGGFFLSGLSNGNMWVNGVAPSMRINDYLPGITGSTSNDPKSGLYIIRSSDPPFGESWQQYRYAVQLGADFYDGDGDGIYHPVDRNGNGVWDLNEDRPDILGEITIWTVINDSKASGLRRFNIVQPQSVDIQQTVFAFSNYTSSAAENIIFIRYRLINRGTVSDKMDSVYFTSWMDYDIGQFIDDLGGCDTLLNSGYGYNHSSDDFFGNNPPAIFNSILQGPPVYIPGKTFIDNNSNGTFDEGIDTPLDTAFVNNGMFLKSKILPGAANIGMSSYSQNGHSHYSTDPATHFHARNLMLGFSKYGESIDPCTWTFGKVTGVPCEQVNPVFMYSGNPVTNYGWINVGATDQNMWVNTGPFELKKDDPVDIIVGYAAGRGSNALNSIAVGKENTMFAQELYKSNFFREEDLPSPLPEQFILFQNFPNPFNSSTTIRFEAANDSPVKLVVYDILGRIVKTLINEFKAAGRYEILFDASHLASGVYFYQLRTDNFIQTKKMVLLK